MNLDACCPDCSRALVDAGDELVCPNCGVVRAKEVLEEGPSRMENGVGSRRQSLGSYMGPRGNANDERFAHHLASSNSRYSYLKLVSDFAGRDEGPSGECLRMLERVAEKLFLPQIVVAEAAAIAQKVLRARDPHRRVSLSAVSAYSLVAACKTEGVASVSVREIISAFRDFGKHVSSSSIIQLMLESPVRTYARRAEDYLTSVLALLSMKTGLMTVVLDEGASATAYFNSLWETARVLLGLVDECETAGWRPSALAASAVFSAETVLALCEKRERRVTQRLMAECGDAAEYTIREQCASVFTPAVKTLVARRTQTLALASAR